MSQVGDLLAKSTKQFYGTLFNDHTALGKLNRTFDPAGKYVADKAVADLTAPAAIPVSAPIAMPGSDDEAVRLARRRKIAAVQAQGGRASTIYSSDDGSSKLGG
jgi:hypothetical protein